jgi:hypothetical protein
VNVAVLFSILGKISTREGFIVGCFTFRPGEAYFEDHPRLAMATACE